MAGVSSILILLMLLAPAADCQTFHRDDLDYLVAAFHYPDTLQRDARPDCSKIVEWHIIKPGKGERAGRDYKPVKFSRTKHWVYYPNPLRPEDGQIKTDWRGDPATYGCANCEFRIMIDWSGHELQRNVLTLWQSIGKDSVTYVCGQPEGFDTGIGFAKVSWLTYLPDGSLFLAAQLGGEGHQGFAFFRSSELCRFERFFSNLQYWHEGDTTMIRVSYTFEHLLWPDHHLTEITEYTHTERVRQGNMRSFRVVVDSATTKVIDLWQMAREHFHLDSPE